MTDLPKLVFNHTYIFYQCDRHYTGFISTCDGICLFDCGCYGPNGEPPPKCSYSQIGKVYHKRWIDNSNDEKDEIEIIWSGPGSYPEEEWFKLLPKSVYEKIKPLDPPEPSKPGILERFWKFFSF